MEIEQSEQIHTLEGTTTSKEVITDEGEEQW